jgi:hypothetical protein
MFRLSESEYKKRYGKLPKKEKSLIPKIDSELEEELAFHLKSIGLNGFTRQYKFHPDREWKLDFYREGWGIEVQGGGWVRGGHNRNALSLARDYQKFNACAELGIRLLLYTGEQIKDGSAISQIERIFK